MSPSAGPILTGAAAIQAAGAIKEQFDRAAAWPFDWIYRPAGSLTVFRQSLVPAPDTGVQVEVLAYKVPDSMQFVLCGLVLGFTGSVYTPGDAIFTVDINLPVGGQSAAGVAFNGFGAVQTLLGSTFFPWPVDSGEADKLKARDTLRVKVQNVNVAAGGSNVFAASIVGYTMPRSGNR